MSDNSVPILKFEGVKRIYKTATHILEVLSDINLELQAGETAGLVAPSGAGKSTLLHLAGLLEAPQGGKIFLEGKDCVQLNDDQRTILRRKKLGFIYQFHNLLAEFDALDNVAIPLLIADVKLSDARKYAAELLAQFGLEERAHHRPAELSGGEQQRVAIARALVNRPKLLIADEPTGNLDISLAQKVFTHFSNLAKAQNIAVLVATHNMSLAHSMDRVLTIENGQIHTFSKK